MNNKCLEIGFKEMRSGCLNYGCVLDKTSNRPAYKLLKGGKESASDKKKLICYSHMRLMIDRYLYLLLICSYSNFYRK